MKKNIIFDYDGTLVEFPVKFMFEETHRVVSASGMPSVSDQELEECFSDFDFFRFARNDVFAELLRRGDPGGRPKDPIEAEEAFKELYWKEFKWHEFPLGKPFPETIETLERLQNMGYLLSIATARVIEPQELLSEMHDCGIGRFFSFDVIQTRGSHLDNWKDKSTQISRLISTTGISAAGSVIVGDIPSDIVSGQSLELGYTIAVQSGGIRKDVLEAAEPDAVLLHLGDLPNLLIDLEF
jgi:phosphoglycolate phosphatase-like HAD superfamily hydrolase